MSTVSIRIDASLADAARVAAKAALRTVQGASGVLGQSGSVRSRQPRFASRIYCGKFDEPGGTT